MTTHVLFISLLLTTMARAHGGKFEEDKTNMNHKGVLLRNCTLKDSRISSTTDYDQGASSSKRKFADLTFIKHNYFLLKTRQDQPARPPGCPRCREFSVTSIISLQSDSG